MSKIMSKIMSKKMSKIVHFNVVERKKIHNKKIEKFPLDWGLLDRWRPVPEACPPQLSLHTLQHHLQYFSMI